MLGDVGQLETVERLIRRGVYTGPLVLNHVMIGGGADGPNPYNMMEFIRRVPAGAVLTIEGLMRNVLPLNTMAIAMGLHVRVGIEDNLWGRKGERMTSVQADRADGAHRARAAPRSRHRRAGQGRSTRSASNTRRADETLAKLGYAPEPPVPANAARRCAWRPDRLTS